MLVFDLTLMQDATENCHNPELVGEPLRLELNFTFPLEHDPEETVNCFAGAFGTFLQSFTSFWFQQRKI